MFGRKTKREPSKKGSLEHIWIVKVYHPDLERSCILRAIGFGENAPHALRQYISRTFEVMRNKVDPLTESRSGAPLQGCINISNQYYYYRISSLDVLWEDIPQSWVVQWVDSGAAFVTKMDHLEHDYFVNQNFQKEWELMNDWMHWYLYAQPYQKNVLVVESRIFGMMNRLKLIQSVDYYLRQNAAHRIVDLSKYDSMCQAEEEIRNAIPHLEGGS